VTFRDVICDFRSLGENLIAQQECVRGLSHLGAEILLPAVLILGLA